MFSQLFTFLLTITQNLGHLGVGVLMAVESSFIPMPSEIVVPPAAYLASQGVMNIYLVVIAGIVGSLVGALFNYFLAYYLGRPLVYKLAQHRFAKYLLISPEKIERAEQYFADRANSATFLGRLIPVIRQLISLPAGFSKMPLKNFIFYTFLGSSLWVSILALLGYFIGSNQALLHTYYTEIKWIALGLGLIYIIWQLRKIINKKNAV